MRIGTLKRLLLTGNGIKGGKDTESDENPQAEETLGAKKNHTTRQTIHVSHYSIHVS